MEKTASRPLYKLTASALVTAAYVAIMYLTQGFAFGAVQIRIATALYALAFLHPYLTAPLALANCLSNMAMGGLGIFDTVGGFAAGLVTCLLLCLLRKKSAPVWSVFFPVMLGPGLIVSLWLSHLLSIPYPVMAGTLCLEQVAPALCGVALVRGLKNKI